MGVGRPLGATAQAALVLLAFGEASGYELKQRADNTLRYFFASPAMSQIYAELGRLSQSGLVAERMERNKTIYGHNAPKGKAERHLLSGLSRCAECGGPMHAELAKFSWAKLIVKMRLGALADSASWEGAASNMEKAVELAPSFIYHRLDLAETYLAMKRSTDARSHLLKIESLPIADVRDSIYKVEAKRLLAKTE